MCESAVDTGRTFGTVCYGLGAIYAFEFTLWKYAAAAEMGSQSTCERTTFDFPEFGDGDFRHVDFPCRAHRREKSFVRSSGARCAAEYKVGFVGQGVDCVDYIVIVFDVELVCGRRRISFLHGVDVRVGVYVGDSACYHVDFRLSDGRRKSRHSVG